MTVRGIALYSVDPQVGDTGYALVFPRPISGGNDVEYKHADTEIPNIPDP